MTKLIYRHSQGDTTACSRQCSTPRSLEQSGGHASKADQPSARRFAAGTFQCDTTTADRASEDVELDSINVLLSQ
jgi:hypothetical protein